MEPPGSHRERAGGLEGGGVGLHGQGAGRQYEGVRMSADQGGVRREPRAGALPVRHTGEQQ